MAHHKSAKKSIRKTKARTVVTRARRSRVRSFIKKVEEAILTGDKVTASAALSAMQSEIFAAVNKGVMHFNTASRKVSRMSMRVKNLA